jgi:amidohydrolase
MTFPLTNNRLLDEAKALLPELIALRRHLHAHPELSFREEQTASFVSQTLSSWGIKHQTHFAGFGITGVLESETPGPVIALRADMDALPIKEINDVPYKSVNDGIMHACGHDVHTTCLLGALLILKKYPDRWRGKVQFIFQPGEEKLPGGASLMIKEGVLGLWKPEAIFGLHVFNPLRVGTAGFCPGKYMASSDELYITVKGKGGHGATPEETIDPVPISAHLITALQSLVSRAAKPTIPSVLTIGKIIADGATNIIPSVVKMEGTFRTMDEAWRALAHEKILRLCRDIPGAFGATCEVKIVPGYPCLVNDVALTNRATEKAKVVLGENNVKLLDIRMASEDFAYYSQQVPACFFRLGTGNPDKGITAPVHRNDFDVDEDCLAYGAALLAGMAE